MFFVPPMWWRSTSDTVDTGNIPGYIGFHMHLYGYICTHICNMCNICNRSWSPDFFPSTVYAVWSEFYFNHVVHPRVGFRKSGLAESFLRTLLFWYPLNNSKKKHLQENSPQKAIDLDLSPKKTQSFSYQTSTKKLSFPAACRYPLEPQTKSGLLEPVGVLIWQSVEFFKRHLYIGQYWSIFIFHYFEMLGLLGRIPPALLSVEVPNSRYDSYYAQIYIVSRQTNVGLKKEEPWEWFPKSDISAKLQGKATPICGWILLPWPEKLEAQNSSLDSKKGSLKAALIDLRVSLLHHSVNQKKHP